MWPMYLGAEQYTLLVCAKMFRTLLPCLAASYSFVGILIAFEMERARYSRPSLIFHCDCKLCFLKGIFFRFSKAEFILCFRELLFWENFKLIHVYNVCFLTVFLSLSFALSGCANKKKCLREIFFETGWKQRKTWSVFEITWSKSA